MNIRIEKEEKNITIILSGRLDTSTVTSFHDSVAACDFFEIEEVIFDFSNLEYISSAGLRELLITRKKAGQARFTLRGVNEMVMNVLSTTGFTNLFNIEQIEETIDYRSISFKELLDYKLSVEAQRIVFKYNNISYSWDDVEKISQIIAFDLSKMGVRKGSHVALCGMNSANWILTFYAIQKLGAIAVLTNSSLMPSEIEELISCGDVTHFCYGQMPGITDYFEFARNLPSPYDIRDCVNYLDRIVEYERINELFKDKVYCDDACVMIFTSGSTGKPKGVLLSAYNIVNATLTANENTRLSSKDKVCLILPLFHVFGLVGGLIADCISGAMLLLPTSLNIDDLMKTIEEEQCTVFHSMPTMFLAIANNKSFSIERFSTLRSSILGGAPVSTSQMKMLMEKFPNNHFTVAYGLSEIVPISMTEYGDTPEHIAETIGKPVGDAIVRVWGDNGECKHGQIGEIHVQGINLMTCYYKVEIDRQSIDDEGWLHTGDLGFFDEDGYLHYVGRKNSLIIRGEEVIYPTEIEEALCSEESIADAKVIGIPDEILGEKVGAAVILKDGYDFDENSLKSSMKTRIEENKIPDKIIVLDEYPSLANGKADLATLKKIIKAASL